MLKVWTDGSCLGNPGNGGWAFIITDGVKTAERSGAVPSTTNNRMELLAAIEALSAIKKHTDIELHLDSQYVKNGIQVWIKNWKKNNWKNANKKPVANQDLWQQLDDLVSKFNIKWVWIRGHNGDEINEKCDELARKAAEKL